MNYPVPVNSLIKGRIGALGKKRQESRVYVPVLKKEFPDSCL